MASIQNLNLQKIFPAPVYRRGLEYYKQDRVSDLLYDINYQVWTASVRGSEMYFVEINMADLEKGSIQTYCDCPAFSTYNTCKHIVATLIAISKKPSSNIPAQASYDYQTTNQLIHSITSLQQPMETSEIITSKVPLKVEYYIKWTYDRHLFLELKAGEKRPFVVKNAQEFLGNVLSGNEHYFTKTFTYNPDTHYFLRQDIDIFEMLYSILRNEQIYVDRAFYHYQDTSERSIVIPPLLIEPLLDKLIERQLTVETREKRFEHVDVVKGELPFRFAISKNKQGEMVLAMDEMDSMIYFSMYQLLFSQGIFYFPAKEQLPIVEQLDTIGIENHRLPITKKQADVFVSEVLPTLKKVGEVQISDNVASEIIQVPLRAKLYLDVQAEWIVGRLEYHYGEHQIDPFNGREQDEVIIIRDVTKEQQIMRLIEQANFHYNGKELYIEADEESVYEFLYHALPLFEQYVELFLTSEVRHLIVENEPNPSTSVRIESSSNLLEVGFTIEGINDNEINQILNAVMEKKRYYRLQSGALLSLEGEEFSSIKQLFTDLDIKKSDVQDGNVQLPAYRGVQIDELIDTKKDYDPSFRRLLNQLKSPEEQVYPLPDQLQATLRDYQKTGYQWFKSLSNYQLGGILADDMGLGKTLQSIAYMVSEQGDKPHLIVAPSSVLYNWKNECQKFAPDLQVAIMTGTPTERQVKIQEQMHMDVWITSYATLRQDIEFYRDLSFQTLILDEAQYIKNYATKTSQAIREIKASKRFALSGTPIENSIDELWAIFQVILPGLMPNQRAFRQLSHEKIAMLTKPFILRRLKQDVLKELPDKIETVSVSELTKPQKELYLGYLRQLQQEAAQSMKDHDFHKNRMKILAGLTRLRQICCHPSLFIENYEGKSGKLEQLMETVRNAVENGKRMLIFSQFTSMHEIIIRKLAEEGIDYFYLHGSTPSQERVQISERFNNGEKSVFLISLKAGGTGLNLTGADTVILYDLWWNPAVEDQATGRAHRFGQKNVVQVIRLVTEGTIEEKIYDLQQKKRELIDQVIKPGESMLSSLSEDDIKELLSL
ncbi:DEAD/DEAH box helicase [Lentibacillus sp. Marseille-P4043]|uniref:DEAD/DEAH box helicase n=1 Tax=Lentibacillus sp. Marseille-P4043 TaxID=2040293 RepID=UPI000D0BB50F|nr:DEAD/DEAH box helicase [Lentibacillus sp. Marseille-P4043]